MKRIVQLCQGLLLLVLLLNPVLTAYAAPSPQAGTPEELARQLLDRMKPEERVGQLFLVTFKGPDAQPSTSIYKLIYDYHVGGVILQAQNDNFSAPENTLPYALNLNRQLQAAEFQASEGERIEAGTGEAYAPAFVPLFIGISQEGDGYPYDHILSGLTPIPSQMAIGATWNPDLAEKVGELVGNELSLLGFNLLLGPSLDVLETPHEKGGSDLGIRTFGGDPYWVGEMGRAYIRGVHSGSEGEMAVVAKHFPGFGSSDRLPEEEVATIRKSLEQFKLIDLAPFFAVTGSASSPEATADALLTSHIRLQGFQENIRQTTRPVTLDPGAFKKLMDLEPLSAWRTSGGVMISDELGGAALRRFYEASGQSFTGRFVALSAFQAGNDLLYLGDYSNADDPDPTINIIRTIEFFTQKYREDAIFAQRVDESVLRILTLKARLYGSDFTLNRIMPPSSLSSSIGKSSQLSFQVLQEAATLISPNAEELGTSLPDPPARNENIVFITDTRYERQCSACLLQPSIPVDTLQKIVIRLYSPGAGGQVLPGNLLSYTMDDLETMLDSGPGILQLEGDLKNASWIVFSVLNPDTNIPSTSALMRFMNERPDLQQGKKLVVFAFNAPYYLDATDISKLSAYYALYSKTPRAFDVAARLLFQEIGAVGASPVSIGGVGYDLNDITFPDPAQTIAVLLDIEGSQLVPTSSATPEPTPPPLYKIGDTVPVKTSLILDRNAHPVPDNTVVRFTATRADGGIAAILESFTIQGIARATFRMDSPGTLDIRAESEFATQSTPLRIEVPQEGATLPPPTDTPEPTITETTTATPSVTPAPTLTPTPIIFPPDAEVGDWMLSVLSVAAAAVLTYLAGAALGQARWGIRSALLVLIGGLLAYSYLALDMPGSEGLLEESGGWGVIGITLIGAAAGWLAAFAWRSLLKRRLLSS